MKLNEREKLWIQRNEDTNALTISGEWFDEYGSDSEPMLSKLEANELFEIVKDTIKAKYPNIVINPWIDAPEGTLD